VKTSTSKAIRHRKNNTLRLLPGGAAVARAYGYLGRVIAAPPRNSKLKSKKTTTPGMLKKIFWLSLLKIYQPTTMIATFRFASSG
ncbi:hypothetical protein, partial [Enterobacter intestinihominis]